MLSDYDVDIDEVTMNRIGSSSPDLTYPTASHLDDSTFSSIAGQRHESAHRLIVLIPADSDYTSATRRISELANASGAQVLFLGLCKDAARELSLRRELAILTALLRHARVYAEAKVEIGTNWIDVVKINFKEGDVIVCLADQRTGFFRGLLSQILESRFSASVYILSNLYPQKSKSKVLSQVIAWLGFIGIIISFGLLQAQVVQLPEGWLQSILLMLSIIPEFWLIWIWNNLFS